MRDAMKFSPGQVVATPTVIEAINEEDVQKALIRHLRGDWGELDDEDRKANDRALKSGEERMLSAYKDRHGTKFWIITEWDRSLTTILLPSDY